MVANTVEVCTDICNSESAGQKLNSKKIEFQWIKNFSKNLSMNYTTGWPPIVVKL